MPANVRCELMDTLGSIYTDMGLIDTAAALAAERSKLAQRAFGTQSVEFALALIEQARNTVLRGEPAEAMPLLDRARQALVAIPGSSEALATAWVRYGAVAGEAGNRGFMEAGLAAQNEARRWLAHSRDAAAHTAFLVNAGVMDMYVGQFPRAAQVLRDAVAAIAQQGRTEQPKGLTAISWLGHAELAEGRPDEAHKHLAESARLAARTPVPLDELWLDAGLSHYHEVAGDYERAWQVAHATVARIAQLPDVLVTPEMSASYLNLARAAYKTGRVEASLRYLVEAEALRRRKATYDADASLRDLQPASWVGPLLAAGDLDGANASLRSLASGLGVEKRVTLRTLRYFEQALEVALASRSTAQAQRVLQDMRERNVTPDLYRIYQQWKLRTQLASLRMLQGDFGKADVEISRVLSDIAAHPQSAFWGDARLFAQQALLDLRLQQGRNAEALHLAHALADELGQRQADGLSLDQMHALQRLALAQARLARTAEARDSLKRANAIAARHPGLGSAPRDRFFVDQLALLGVFPT